MKIWTASYSDIGGRPYNEDTVGIKTIGDDRACVIVADGLGGHGGGDRASQEAVRMICDGWNGSAAPNTLTDLIQGAHRHILEMQTAVCKMKSTVVLLSLEPQRMDWAYAGDSRLYHFQEGKIVYQTIDHSASQIAVALGQITPQQIRFHEDRSRVFRALGQENGLIIDAYEKQLAPGRHVFLLCTDGFWEYVYENEMEKTLETAESPEVWLNAMRGIHDSRVSGSYDNHTAAAVWLTI